MSKYEIAKYKNAEVGLIDTIRVCHASNCYTNELMKTGTIEVDEQTTTWERLRSEGKSFKEILSTIKIPHMALLKNLRNIFKELDNGDNELATSILNELVGGVKGGKQFPFRYYQALNQIKNCKDIHYFKTLLMDKLEECIDVSLDNMPKLKGKTACLCDNSGSAWGTFNSEYGTMTIAEIGNLSSVITAMNSEDGEIFAFGDRLINYPISKRNGALYQAKHISEDARRKVGGGTENGIWLFFKEAIEKKIKYDNIFIYSDMQAGHGGASGQKPHPRGRGRAEPERRQLHRQPGTGLHGEALRREADAAGGGGLLLCVPVAPFEAAEQVRGKELLRHPQCHSDPEGQGAAGRPQTEDRADRRTGWLRGHRPFRPDLPQAGGHERQRIPQYHTIICGAADNGGVTRADKILAQLM